MLPENDIMKKRGEVEGGEGEEHCDKNQFKRTNWDWS